MVATASVPTASAGPVTAAAAPVLGLVGAVPGASDVVTTPTSDEATTALVAAAARILRLRVAAISLASFSVSMLERWKGGEEEHEASEPLMSMVGCSNTLVVTGGLNFFFLNL